MSYSMLVGCHCDIIVLNVHVPSKYKCDNVKDGFYKDLEHVFYQFYNFIRFYCLGGKGKYFKLTVGNLHETSNNNGVRVVNFTTSKNIVVKVPTLQNS